LAVDFDRGPASENFPKSTPLAGTDRLVILRPCHLLRSTRWVWWLAAVRCLSPRAFLHHRA
jgi:hypothetical protein